MCARQHRSTSSPWKLIAASNPPRARNRSARTSKHADGTAKTSVTASCCSWSTSPTSTRPAGLTEPVDVESDVLQDPRVVPGDDLRPDDAGVGAVQLLDHQTDGVGTEGDIVVTEAEEAVVAVDELRHDVGGWAESRVGPDVLDVRLRKDAVDPGGEVVVGTVGDEEHGAQRRVVLGRQRFEALLEPRADLVDDDRRQRPAGRQPRPVAERVRRPRCSEAIAVELAGRHEVDNVLQCRRHERSLLPDALAIVSTPRYVVQMTTKRIPTIDLTTIKLPFDLPRINLSAINVPTVDLSNVDVPSAEQIIEWFRDAAFAGTGLVALTAERVADVQKTVLELVKTQLTR